MIELELGDLLDSLENVRSSAHYLDNRINGIMANNQMPEEEARLMLEYLKTMKECIEWASLEITAVID